MAITIAATTQITMAACIQIQIGDIDDHRTAWGRPAPPC
jgi:hypothetical protein